MLYLIDGYNLLHHIGFDEEKFSLERERLIERLKGSVSNKKLSVAVVFDSQNVLGGVSKVDFGSIELIYTSENQTADEFILEYIDFHSKEENITVVTSDRHLSWLARKIKAKTMTIKSFLAFLSKKSDSIESVEDEKKESSLLQQHFNYYKEVFSSKFKDKPKDDFK